MIEQKEVPCTICGRPTPLLYQEKHHLIPKSRKGRKTILVCCNCGNKIHKLFDNKVLERELNTIEAIREHPQVQKWIKWVRKKKDFSVCFKDKKNKRFKR